MDYKGIIVFVCIAFLMTLIEHYVVKPLEAYFLKIWKRYRDKLKKKNDTENNL